MRIAVVGSGIAGLAAARALVSHDVTMFEAAARPGGHVYTVDADGQRIDMGFIVCNRERYPLFCGLLDELGIPTRPTTMSFSVVTDGDHEWGSESLSAMFADRRRLADPRHWRFLAQVVAFLTRAGRDLRQLETAVRPGPSKFSSRSMPLDASREPSSRSIPFDASREPSSRSMPFGALRQPSIRSLSMPRRASLEARTVVSGSLDDYLTARRVSREVRDRFVVPLAAALWSLAPDLCGAFPALTYLQFLDQHGMLSVVRPLRWHTVVGGSQRYVDALLASLSRRGRFTLRLATPVASIARDAHGVTIGHERFDRLVIATHANTALSLLASPTADERRVLGAFRYSTNRTVLHTDRTFLPRRPAAHAAWNYLADPDTARVAVTYSMSRLQGLPDAPYLVTLNPRREPRGVLHEVSFEHPQFDRGALAAQSELAEIGRGERTYYAGAYSRFGFHEDGMRSGVEAAARLLADETRSQLSGAIVQVAQ